MGVWQPYRSEEYGVNTLALYSIVGSKWGKKFRLQNGGKEDRGKEIPTSLDAASRSSASIPSGIPTYVKRSFDQRSARQWSCSKRRRLKIWPTTVLRAGYTPVSSRKRATGKQHILERVERSVFCRCSHERVSGREKGHEACKGQVRFALGCRAHGRGVYSGSKETSQRRAPRLRRRDERERTR